MKARILLLDLETAPILGYAWQKYDTSLIDITEQSYILSAAWKWYGEDKEISVLGLPSYPDYFDDATNDDRLLVADIWKLLDQADIVVAQNGDSFDIKKANARFLVHGMTPPSCYKTVDTLKLAKKYFRFDSNKLDDLCKFLSIGGKMHHAGFAIWKGCLEGDLESWEVMMDYNKQDIVLLESLYLRLRPWASNHPRINLLDKSDFEHCQMCDSENVQRRGYSFTKMQTRQRWHCTDCGGWYTGAMLKSKKVEK